MRAAMKKCIVWGLHRIDLVGLYKIRAAGKFRQPCIMCTVNYRGTFLTSSGFSV